MTEPTTEPAGQPVSPPEKIESMEGAFRVLRRGPERESDQRVEEALFVVFKAIDKLVAQRDVSPHYLQVLMLEQQRATAQDEAKHANAALHEQAKRIAQLEDTIDKVGMQVAERVNALHGTSADVGSFKLRGVVDEVIKECTAVLDEDSGEDE